jgi:hypothetical protein
VDDAERIGLRRQRKLGSLGPALPLASISADRADLARLRLVISPWVESHHAAALLPNALPA